MLKFFLVIYCQDGTLSAHQVLLAANSKFLENIFKSLPADNTRGDTCLVLPDFTGNDVHLMLNFLYGKLTSIDQAQDLFKCVVFGNKSCSQNNVSSNNGVKSEAPALQVEDFSSEQYFVDYILGRSNDYTDIETAEVLIDNNNYDAGADSKELFCVLCNKEAMSVTQLQA